MGFCILIFPYSLCVRICVFLTCLAVAIKANCEAKVSGDLEEAGVHGDVQALFRAQGRNHSLSIDLSTDRHSTGGHWEMYFFYLYS